MLGQTVSLPKILIIGLSGAFTAHMAAGFCMWFVSVSPVFIPIYHFIYSFPSPILLGIVAGLLSRKRPRRNNIPKVFLTAFICTFVGNFVAWIIASFTDISDMVESAGYDRFAINRMYFTVLETISGLVVMSVLIGVIYLWSKYEEIS